MVCTSIVYSILQISSTFIAYCKYPIFYIILQYPILLWHTAIPNTFIDYCNTQCFTSYCNTQYFYGLLQYPILLELLNVLPGFNWSSFVNSFLWATFTLLEAYLHPSWFMCLYNICNLHAYMNFTWLHVLLINAQTTCLYPTCSHIHVL